MKKLFLVLAMLTMTGCATTGDNAISQETLSGFSGKSLVIVERDSPSFVAMTAGKGAFALAGVGAAAVAGNKMVKESNIQDPAMQISKSVAQQLNQQHGVVFSNQSAGVSASGKVDEIVKLAQGNDYVLDVVTKGWSYMYDGFKFSSYYVGYSSELRLIDVNSAQVVSSGKCAYNAKTAGKSPVNRDTLLANDAAYVKQELSDATAHCIQEYSGKLF